MRVWKTVWLTYAYVWGNKRSLAPAMLSIFVAFFVGGEFFGATAIFGILGIRDILSLIYYVLSTAICLSVMVGIHRRVLNNRPLSAFWVFQLDIGVIKYFIVWLVFAVSFIPPAAANGGIKYAILETISAVHSPLAAAVQLVASIVSISLFIIPLRILLAFPATAIGVRRPIAYAWRLTKGKALRLFTVWTLTSMPFLIILVVFAIHALSALKSEGLFSTSTELRVFWAIWNAMFIPIWASMLSLSYREVGGATAIEQGHAFPPSSDA